MTKCILLLKNELGYGDAMKLILKYTLKNITIKPIRTVIIILCFAAVSLAFSMSLAINISSKEAVENQIRTTTGNTDIIVSSSEGIAGDEIILPNGTDTLYVSRAEISLQIHNIENYKYVQKKQIAVLGLDSVKAYHFGMIPKCEEISENEIIISSAVSLMFGYEKGDTLVIPCADGSEISFVIKDIILCENLISLMPQTVIVTSEKANQIMCKDDNISNIMYIDVTDNSKISEVCQKISEINSDIEVQQIMGSQEQNEMISSITSVFFAIFAIVFLMIIFIVSGFSKNIAAERISVIGTLRSIGADKKTAAFSLLSESFVYGILGGIIGEIIFYLIKDTVIRSFVATSPYDNTSYYIPLYIPLIAVFVSAVISCICSLSSVISTAKMPVKDIIFLNKDTCYKISYFKSLLGFIMLIAFFILYIINSDFIVNLIALICFAVGVCLIIPVLLVVISRISIRFTRGERFPVLRLALIQSGTKKTSISGTVLCTAVISLTTAIFVLSNSVDMLYSVQNYNCDVIVSELSEKAVRYENIKNTKGVTASETIYCTEEVVEINNKKITASVFGYDNFKMFEGIKDISGEIEKNEIVFDKIMMERYDISVGDIIDITLKSDTVRPVKLQLKVKEGCDSIYYDMRCNAILINIEDYKKVYYDYPSMLLLNTTDGDVSNQLKNQLADKKANLKTAEEYYKDREYEKNSIKAILYALILLGTALAVISVIGNQSISFEQRKREFAVLYSVSMSKRQLIKMIITESVISAAISLILSVISGVIIVKILSRLLAILELSIPVSFEINSVLIFTVMIFMIIILTTIKPICSLLKMNTAEQLKYE